VNLLSRFYDTDSGEVSVDGINVKEWDIHKLRESMAMVMQDIFLFSDTIEGNIAYGNPEATVESVQTLRKWQRHTTLLLSCLIVTIRSLVNEG
jgi:ATP-binding cassette, subfamily B, multidrug efflux pump